MDIDTDSDFDVSSCSGSADSPSHSRLPAAAAAESKGDSSPPAKSNNPENRLLQVMAAPTESVVPAASIDIDSDSDFDAPESPAKNTPELPAKNSNHDNRLLQAMAAPTQSVRPEENVMDIDTDSDFDISSCLGSPDPSHSGSPMTTSKDNREPVSNQEGDDGKLAESGRPIKPSSKSADHFDSGSHVDSGRFTGSPGDSNPMQSIHQNKKENEKRNVGNEGILTAMAAPPKKLQSNTIHDDLDMDSDFDDVSDAEDDGFNAVSKSKSENDASR